VEAITGYLRERGLQPSLADRPSLRRLANVQHLHTSIEARLPSSVHLLDVAERLHPTPAVGGSPREAALPRIRELEGFERGLYAGALGWVNSRGDGELFVGIRSALIEDCRARLYAGSGIVSGSDPAKELAETELKFRVMEQALLA
jgi:menaquinone-specific isochorismate synthase